MLAMKVRDLPKWNRDSRPIGYIGCGGAPFPQAPRYGCAWDSYETYVDGVSSQMILRPYERFIWHQPWGWPPTGMCGCQWWQRDGYQWLRQAAIDAARLAMQHRPGLSIEVYASLWCEAGDRLTSSRRFDPALDLEWYRDSIRRWRQALGRATLRKWWLDAARWTTPGVQELAAASPVPLGGEAIPLDNVNGKLVIDEKSAAMMPSWIIWETAESWRNQGSGEWVADPSWPEMAVIPIGYDVPSQEAPNARAPTVADLKDWRSRGFVLGSNSWSQGGVNLDEIVMQAMA